jgi:hypothetical protein
LPINYAGPARGIVIYGRALGLSRIDSADAWRGAAPGGQCWMLGTVSQGFLKIER